VIFLPKKYKDFNTLIREDKQARDFYYSLPDQVIDRIYPLSDRIKSFEKLTSVAREISRQLQSY